MLWNCAAHDIMGHPISMEAQLRRSALLRKCSPTLRALTTIGLLCAALPARATTPQTTNGGGTSAPPYQPAFRKFNPGAAIRPPLGAQATAPIVPFGAYLPAGSTIGQKAFLTNDRSCLTNALAGRPGCTGPAGAPGNTVDFAASDLALSGAQITGWLGSRYGQATAGNLIQVPALGLGLAIGVSERSTTRNGALTLSDDDLCGIFAGRITDFSQLSQPGRATGALTVLFRADAAEETQFLTNHLAAVCPLTDGFRPTTKFASLFPLGLARNFLGVRTPAATALELGGCDGGARGRIGYLRPGLTSLYPASDSPLTCGGASTQSRVVVASLLSAGQPTLPTVADIADGLTHPKLGRHLAPPANARAGANPANWAPSVSLVSQGYPIVGYTFWVAPQCSAVPAKSSTFISFLNALYGVNAAAGLVDIVQRNGYATISDTRATGYLAALALHILSNGGTTPWNTDFGNLNTCKTLPGR